MTDTPKVRFYDGASGSWCFRVAAHELRVFRDDDGWWEVSEWHPAERQWIIDGLSPMFRTRRAAVADAVRRFA